MKKSVLALAGVLSVIMLLVGGYIVTTALIYAVISVSAFGFLVIKMRNSGSRVMRFCYSVIHRYPLASDCVFTVITYHFSPGGIIGILGAGTTAVLTSALLMIMPPLEKGKNDKEKTRARAETVSA